VLGHDEDMIVISPARSKVSRVLAAGLFGLAMAESITTIAAAIAAHLSFTTAVSTFTVTDGAMGLAFPLCGVLLAWHRPRNLIGWLFLAAGLGMATSAAAAALLQLGTQSGWNDGTLRLLGTLLVYAWPWSIALFLPAALQLFPDGRPSGRRWRWLLWAAVADSVLFVLSFGSPDAIELDHRKLTMYLAVPGYHQLAALWAAGNLGWTVIFALTIASLAVRYRRGGDTERRQLLWLLLAGLVVLAYAGVIWGVLSSGPILGLLVLPLIPAAVTVAILRYQLLDIRLVVSRALVYGLLSVAAAGAYAGLVALLDLMVRSRVSFGAAVVASIIVAVGFNPARVRLQRVIDRALYGDRRDPVRAVSLLGERLAGAGAAATGLPGVLETLCDSLRLPFAAVRFESAEAAAYGTAPELLHCIGLRYDGAPIGELIVGLRSGQRRLSPSDIAVLQLLAGPLAVALHATALSAALQESRFGIIAAREEERRRLRRDLHDGLGPVLTGIAFRADAARNMLVGLGPGDQPEQVREMLSALRTDTTTAIGDIRRLVYGLRPPALDDLGLIGSLREQSVRLSQRPDGGRFAVCLTAPDPLPPLPAAVEVAAYRIITEALTNAARHSGASRIEVDLALAEGDRLRLEIRDNGAGPQPDWQPGVGLTSIRERAAELGGSCQVGPDPGNPAGGGRVVALLPLGRTSTEGAGHGAGAKYGVSAEFGASAELSAL
jgi:two-component system, NarL family, sensor kinase